MLEALINRFRDYQNKCKTCTVDAIHEQSISSLPAIELLGRVKTVNEYRCQKCHSLWVQPERGRFVTKVCRKELYDDWKKQSVLPTSDQKSVLLKIGGASDTLNTYRFYPCEVRTKTGDTIQSSIIVATTGECFGRFPEAKEFRLLDSSDLISQTPTALPIEIREKSLRAPEKSMGYSPVNVIDAAGTRYTLTSFSNFFQEGTSLGENLRLDSGKLHNRNQVHPLVPDLCLVCDWDG